MERRQFLSWVSVGMLATSLPMVLAACGGSTASSDEATEADADEVTDDATETPSTAAPEFDTAVRADGFQALATVTQVGQAPVLDEDNAAEPVMIFQDPETEALVALNPTCPHAQCLVDLDGESQDLICPCHGSAFATDGSVLTGPAQAPLPVFEVKEEDGLVLVKVS
ncbi:MAG: ubiquinol-cytochrome c reductase iron-sulfur subunit [Spirulinaceae cyanobacterium]